MATLPKPPSGRDIPKLVSTGTDKDVHYWCSHFHISPGLLRETMRAVGDNVVDIETYLLMRDT